MVGPGDDLAVGGEYPRWRQGLERAEVVLAPADEFVVHLMRAHDVVQLLEREEEDVVGVADHAGADETLRLAHEGPFVDEVSADQAVLGILPVPDERADAIDHLLGLLRLARAVRQRPQALEQLPFLLPGLLPSALEAPVAFAGLERRDVGEDHRHERRRSLGPTRAA